MGSTFVLGVLLARHLGPADYGVYGLVIALSALALNIVLFGMPQLAVREMAARTARGDDAGVHGLVASFGRFTLASCAVATLAAVAAALAFAGPGEDRLVAIGVALTVALGLTALVASCLRGLGRLFEGQFMDILGRPVAALVLVGLLLLAGRRIDALDALSVQLVVGGAAAIVSLFWLWRALPARPATVPPIAARSWLGQAAPLGIVDILRTFDGTYALILMSWLASAAELGVFRVALAANVLASLPITAIHVVLAPRVATLFAQRDTAALQPLLRTVSLAMVAALVPALLVLVAFGRPLVVLVFGAAYADAATALAILCAGQLLFGLFGMGPILLAMANAERPLVRIYLVAVAAGVASALALIPLYGTIGAALAQLVSLGVVGFLSDRYARRHFGLTTTFLR